MKKNRAFILPLLVAALLGGCVTGPDNGTENGTGNPYGNPQEYIAQHLKDYSITYAFEGLASGTGTAGAIRTAEGFYCQFGTAGQLFVKNGDTFDVYIGSTDTPMTKSGAAPATQSKVDNSCLTVTETMSQYAEFVSSLQSAGTDKVAGRATNKYTYTATATGFNMSATYWIDKETGVCLKYEYSESLLDRNHRWKKAEATKFVTSGVTLPKHQ